MRWLVLCLVALLTTGCASGRARMYDGPQRPPGEVALLFRGTLGMAIAGGTPTPVELDGKPVPHTKWVECLPGEHTIKWSFSDSDGVRNYSASGGLTFDAEAGHAYQVVGECQGKTSISVSIHDCSNSPEAKAGWAENPSP